MWPRVTLPDKGAEASRLSSTLLHRVRLIQGRLEGLAEAVLRGDRLSGFPGRGLEVAGVREYHSGDEARGIDWRVTARTGRLHVKEFEEERDLSSLVILHHSWAFRGGRGGIRQIRALEIAGLLSALSLKEGDRAGLVQSGGEGGGFIPPARGPHQLPRIVASLLEPPPGAPEESLPSLLTRTRNLVKERSRVFLVAAFHLSEDRMDELRRELGSMAQRHALVPVRILDSEEGVYEGSWPLPLEDLDRGVLQRRRGGEKRPVLRDLLDEEEREVGKLLETLGLAEWRVDVSTPLLSLLQGYLARDRWSGGSRV